MFNNMVDVSVFHTDSVPAKLALEAVFCRDRNVFVLAIPSVSHETDQMMAGCTSTLLVRLT